MNKEEIYLKLTNNHKESKKDKLTLKQVLLLIFITFLLINIILFATGFIMAKNGHRPQKLDLSAFTNKVFGSSEAEEYWELEKIEESP